MTSQILHFHFIGRTHWKSLMMSIVPGKYEKYPLAILEDVRGKHIFAFLLYVTASCCKEEL